MHIIKLLAWCGLIWNFHIDQCLSRNVQTWVQSPVVTDWGDWGSADICPDNTFVGSFELKVEENVRGQDDTALNGISFLCIDLEGGERNWISSRVGDYGIMRGRRNCNNGLATGFKLRSETDQHGGDDVAGVDMALYCTNSDGSTNELVGSGLHDWGDWTAEQHCPLRTAICGIKTQVEGSQGSGDDTALNNVKVACCPLPPICENCALGKLWKRTLGCHQSLRDCTLKITTGLEKTTSTSTSISQSISFYSKVGVTAEAGVAGEMFSASVSANAEWGQEQVNGRTIEQIVSTMSFEHREVSVTLDCIGWAEELVITRGNYELATGEFRCTPFENQGDKQVNPSTYSDWQTSGNVQWRHNCDFQGGDIGSEASRGEDCGSICESRGDCRNFVWTNYNGGTCWLKGDGVNPAAVDKFDSGAVCGWVNRQPQQQTSNSDWKTSGNVQWRQNCDFQGGDIGSEGSRGEDCGGICERRGDCRNFVWTDYNGGTCWLKGDGVNPAAVDKFDSGAVCGWVNRQPEQQTSNSDWKTSGNVQWRWNCDFQGGDIGSEASRGEDCGGICERRGDCRNFVWTNYNGGTCWIKGDGVNPAAVDKFDSGAVCGWVNRPQTSTSDWQTSGNVQWRKNCDFEGGDIGSEASRGEDCGGICNRRGDCTHFTWTDFNGGTCWLKGNGVNPGAVNKFDSGAVCGWVNR